MKDQYLPALVPDEKSTQLNETLKIPVLLSSLWVNERVVLTINYLAHTWLQWISISSQPVSLCLFTTPAALSIFYSTIACSHFSDSWPVNATQIQVSLCLEFEGIDLEHPTEKPRSKVCVVYEVCIAWSPNRQLPQSARLIWSAPSVQSDVGHFVSVTTSLKAPTGTEISDCHPESAVLDPWFSY